MKWSRLMLWMTPIRLFILLSFFTNAYEIGVPPMYAPYGIYSCPATGYSITAHPSAGFLLGVGPPLFSEPQVVIQPGHTAYIRLDLKGYAGNNVSQLIQPKPEVGQNWAGSQLLMVDWYTWIISNSSGIYGYRQLQGGLTVTVSNFTIPAADTAFLTLKLVAAPSAPLGSYWLFGGHPCASSSELLTIGSIPYWQSCWSCGIQPITFLVDEAVSAAVAFVYAVIMRELQAKNAGTPQPNAKGNPVVGPPLSKVLHRPGLISRKPDL